jgi:hypothetical protein
MVDIESSSAKKNMSKLGEGTTKSEREQTYWIIAKERVVGLVSEQLARDQGLNQTLPQSTTPASNVPSIQKKVNNGF